MEWIDAEKLIRQRILVGTDVNSTRSTHRIVREVDYPCNRYDYAGTKGFIVPIGMKTTLQIPWSMLRECFTALSSPTSYSGCFFRRRFPLQAKDHPCHFQTIGQIFVKAGFAQEDAGTFILVRNYRQ